MLTAQEEARPDQAAYVIVDGEDDDDTIGFAVNRKN